MERRAFIQFLGRGAVLAAAGMAIPSWLTQAAENFEEARYVADGTPETSTLRSVAFAIDDDSDDALLAKCLTHAQYAADRSFGEPARMVNMNSQFSIESLATIHFTFWEPVSLRTAA